MIKYGISEYEILKSEKEAILKGLKQMRWIIRGVHFEKSDTWIQEIKDVDDLLNEHSK